MENENTSSTTNEGLKEIDKQTHPVMSVSYTHLRAHET